MSKQIAVRLDDDLVAFIDGLVRAGEAPSRAAVVARAVEQQQRRRAALADVAILTASGGDADDLTGLADFAAGTPMDDLA